MDLAVQRIARAASIPHPVSPHQLRHTLATLAINRGMTLESIARVMEAVSQVRAVKVKPLSPRLTLPLVIEIAEEPFYPSANVSGTLPSAPPAHNVQCKDCNHDRHPRESYQPPSSFHIRTSLRKNESPAHCRPLNPKSNKAEP